MPAPLAPEALGPKLPLRGKTILLVHPAWDSCGSHQVFVCQARAYRSLGAIVISLAVADSPFSGSGPHASEGYLAATGDLEADLRIFARTPLRKIWLTGFLRVGWQWLAGNYAATRLAVVQRAVIPDRLAAVPRIDLIHCNHFFCMQIATRLRTRHGCPILLDTHDLQARQYALNDRGGVRFWCPPNYEDMLALELNATRSAELLLHLNAEEAAAFQKLLPEKRQVLLYPAVAAMPAGAGGGEAIIVASSNYPNFLGLRWFLQEVLPLARNARVQIFGNIDRLFRRRAPHLFKQHAGLFQGRVEIEKLRDAYRNASAVLLPATAGHGISIKTVEALSCGAPLIATPLAFRGFPAGAAALPNVTIAEDAASFAAALRRACERRHLPDLDRASSPTRRLYQQYFAFDVYCQSLCEVVDRLMEKEIGRLRKDN
jgi:polysaccharide biosynthesis protein PslH